MSDSASQFRDLVGIEGERHVDELTTEEITELGEKMSETAAGPAPAEDSDTEPEDTEPEDTEPEDTEPEVDAFDPSEHTAAEVNDYIEANPDEGDAVIEAERAGKNRKTITGDA